VPPPTLTVERIDDPEDPRLADYRDLRDHLFRLRRGLFIAESRTIVRRLLEGRRFRTRSILLTQPALDALCDVLDTNGAGATLYVSHHEIIKAVAGFDFHRGCLAVAERGVEPSVEALIASAGTRLLLVLEDVSNPDNVGGVFRNAMAFGADGVLLSSGCADPLYRKAIRVSVGGTLSMPFAHLTDWTGGLGRLRDAGYTLLALTPDPAALDLEELGHKRPLPARIAFLLGSEGQGLAPATKAAADLEVRIAMAPGADSLNVATASGIALHRLRALRT